MPRATAPAPMYDRRAFLRTTASSLTLLLSRQGLSAAQTPAHAVADGPPVGFAVIGAGPWGREILAALGRVAAARVGFICDSYQPLLDRAAAGAPRAQTATDWRRVLDAPDIDAIVIATPTPAHHEIAVAALAAGKHVYCEAPLAATVADARAIARAAKKATGVVFQAGLQGRANSLYRHVRQFVDSGVLGDVALINAQWNRRDSWRRAAPNREREEAVNWRVADGSPGLMGEVGIHQLDLIAQYLHARPSAFVASSSIAAWRDGRTIADTVVSLVEFPKTCAHVRATLASSFGGSYTVFQGSNSSLLLKENHAWLIKEADSPLLGWEVYARKETVHDESGIALVADATKLLQAGREPGAEGRLEPEKPPLVLAFEQFIESIRQRTPSICDGQEGFAATVAAIKANEAAVTKRRVEVSAGEYSLEETNDAR